MTPRSFWAIAIKILGIHIILQSLVAIPQLFVLFYELAQPPRLNYATDSLLFETYYSVISIAFYGGLFMLSIFKTNWIIDTLQLDQGFEDERFELNIHRSTILKIATMVIGGILFVNSFPVLCKSIFDCFTKTDIYGGFNKNPETGFLLVIFLKTLLGYFMLTCSRMIVNYMELKNRTHTK